ncbi:MAG: four helix bundle protein [Candidatus Acidiferrales bacterium]
MAIRTYRDLEVFQESYAAALDVSKLAKRFPPFEQLELGRQIRRAARSIPANIVEGWAKRQSVAEFKRYLQVAVGSCDEVKMWLEMSKDEGYISQEIFETRTSRYNRIGAMLASLWKNWQGPAR